MGLNTNNELAEETLSSFFSRVRAWVRVWKNVRASKLVSIHEYMRGSVADSFAFTG